MSTCAVIVTFHTGPALWDAVASATDQCDHVVVVDNGNPDGVRDRLANTDGIVHIPGDNVGFATACNRGAAQGLGDYLLFINPDAQLRPGAVQALRSALAPAMAPAIVGARLLGADGREQRGARRRALTPASALISFTPLHRLARFESLHRETDPVPDEPLRVDVVSGAAMMMRRPDFESLDGFDAGYFLHVEDIDICRRARDAGGEVLFVPGAQVRHLGSTSAASPHIVEWHKARGFLRYFSRHHSRLGTMLAAPAIVTAIMGRSWLNNRKRPG